METLHPSADLRVEGLVTSRALLTEPCVLTLGDSHLRVLPPPRTADDAGTVLRVLRSWMQPDTTTGLPEAGHLLDALADGCLHPEDRCRLVLLLIRPRPLGLASARTLRRALPTDTLLCRVGPEEVAAVLPDGLQHRLVLPSEWRHELRACAVARHLPERLLLDARQALSHHRPPGDRWVWA